MGDLQRSLSASSSSTSSSASLDLHPLSIDSELWLMAEQRTQEILCTIQPALASQQKRKEVIDYIQRLIKGYYATEVFPFGSVPLKTYLPDGDIDLTALSHPNMEEDLAREVCNILKCEEKDPVSQVKDVQYIQAQVKIVKCSVKNISVDISFNQMTGLCALCFLEQVDQFIGRDHLFKCSVILIKAWCFYESRILGAHHGLISTYALEIMVLYIINLFHSSLPGPLAVLYRFLDYYSTFDWDNYCVSINGPISISSLSEIVELPENDGNILLLRNEFLRKCKEMFSVPTKGLENGNHEFPIKYLNIVDPLKHSNNLGRSVNKGNFHRIRCALSYGAQKLVEILVLPGKDMGVGIEKFFKNTLDQNGKGQRPDAQVPVPAFGTGRSEASALSGDYDMYCSSLLNGQWYHNHTLPIPLQPISPLSPSQIQQINARDALCWTLPCNSKRGTDVFIPRISLCHPYASQRYAATPGIDETGKSRGTGTYIPNMNCHPYRGSRSCMKVIHSDSWTHSSSLNSSLWTDQVEDPPETEKNENRSCIDQFALKTQKSRDNDNCLDLSLDQFPLLPCNKNSVSSESHQSHPAVTKSCQAKDCSASLDNIIHFGIFGCSLSQLSSSMARKQAKAGVSTTLETMPDIRKMEMHKQQELLDSNGEMILRKQFKEKNDEDFPPLCM